MIAFTLQRLLLIVPLLLVISLMAFVIIQLPPGNYLDSYIEGLRLAGFQVDSGHIESLTRQYGLDQPLWMQYYLWMRNFLLHGDMGWSFQYQRPVVEILAERLPATLLISIAAIVLIWIIAIPIAIYSATRQYSVLDYVFTFFGFLGLSIPNFLLALVLMWVVYATTGRAITGLISREFLDQPWSLAKIIDLLQNVWLPLIIIATAGMASLIRIMRATLLDELRKQYVITARAKGVKERWLIWKYPIRIAMNPVISTIGWMLPAVISGEILVAIVLNLRTIGPALLQAIVAQDMYLAGSIIMVLSTLTVFGTLLSDLLLAWLDPRIRY